MIEGGCLCGGVRYEIGARPRSMTHCHCSMCRKAHGSAFVTFVEVACSDFRYTRGEGSLVRYESSPGCRRPFCPTCGSTLLFESESESESERESGSTTEGDRSVWIAAGSLDGDPGCRPGSHIFVASKAPWFPLVDDLPKFDSDTE